MVARSSGTRVWVPLLDVYWERTTLERSLKSSRPRNPLDKPPVSVRFTERLLSDLVCRLELDAFEPSVHLYLCRDQVETLLQVLSPNSLVVIGGRKHWWPTAERRVAKALRSKGHRVVFIGLKRGTKSDLR